MLKLSGPTHCFTAVAAASLISKPFRVAFAGETVDGREIKEEWLRDIADTYSPEKYTAEVWPEHWRSLSPGGDFKSQGSIASVFVQEDTVDGEKALALYRDKHLAIKAILDYQVRTHLTITVELI